MANTGFKGIDVRQTGTALLFRAFQTTSGAVLTSGTTTLELYELQSDGTLSSYDFNSNTFNTTALTTATVSMTQRTGNNSTTNTGIWTYALATVSGFTIGAVYLAIVRNSSADVPVQCREFQYGSEQGDLYVVASGTTGKGYLGADVEMISAASVSTTTAQIGVNVVNYAGHAALVDANNLPKVDVEDIKGTASAGAAGYFGPDWGNVNAPTTTVGLTGTTISGTQTVASVSGSVGSISGILFPTNFASLQVDSAGRVLLMPTQTGVTIPTVTNVTTVGSVTGTVGAIQYVTFPANFGYLSIDSSGRTLLQPTQTGVTIPTVTNLTNAPTSGDFTATMKSSLNAATPASVTGAVGSVTGNVGGNVVGSVGSISGVTFPTNFSSLSVDSSGRVLLQPTQPSGLVIPTVTTVTTTTNLTNAGPDTSGTTTLLSRVTSARAGYLDNLNISGAVASHSDVLAINTSSAKHIILNTVGEYLASEAYIIEMRTFAATDGSAVNADSTPTLTATGTTSGSLSSNLSSATNPATGVYRWTYTVPSSPTYEQIRFDGSATISSATFTMSAYTQTVQFGGSSFGSTQASQLTAIYNKLPTNNIADETVILAALPAVDGSGRVLLQPTQTGVTIPTVTNLTNAPTSGDFTATMKSSLNASTPASVGSVTANVNTNANSTETAIKAKTDLIATNSMDSPNSVTAHGDVTSIYGKLPANNIADETVLAAAIAALPSASSNATATAAAILATPANKLATNSDGSVNGSFGSGTVNANVTEWLGHAVHVDSGNNPQTVPVFEPVFVVPPPVAAASQSPATISALRGDSFSMQLPQMGNLTGWTKLYFTAKNSVNDADSAAVLQIVLNASGGTNGLMVLNGATASDPTQASLTITDVTNGYVMLTITNTVMAQMPVAKLVWDCQWDYSGGDETPINGTFIISADVTRATS